MKAGLLSLLFPGFGDIYLGHIVIAIGEIIGAVFMWFIFLSAVSTENDAQLNIIFFVIPFVLAHVPDMIFTFYVGRKGLYPVKR